MLVGACGCALVSTSMVPVAVPQRPVDRLTLGMTRVEVAAIMDARVIVSYEIDPVNGASKPVEARNLYSSEIVDINGVSCQIDRYIIHPPVAARVADAELYPVVYKNGLLIAKGMSGLSELKAQK